MPATVNQGDRLRVPSGGYCTIGYVDNTARTITTAKHCADAAFSHNTPFAKVGFGVISRTPPTHLPDRDIAYIHLSDNVEIGDNQYSTNVILTHSDVEAILNTTPNTQVCSLSRRANTTHCKPVTRIDHAYLYSRGATNRSGDSGGPVWLIDDQGKPLGFVGVISATGDDEDIYALNPD